MHIDIETVKNQNVKNKPLRVSMHVKVDISNGIAFRGRGGDFA